MADSEDPNLDAMVNESVTLGHELMRYMFDRGAETVGQAVASMSVAFACVLATSSMPNEEFEELMKKFSESVLHEANRLRSKGVEREKRSVN